MIHVKHVCMREWWLDGLMCVLELATKCSFGDYLQQSQLMLYLICIIMYALMVALQEITSETMLRNAVDMWEHEKNGSIKCWNWIGLSSVFILSSRIMFQIISRGGLWFAFRFRCDQHLGNNTVSCGLLDEDNIIVCVLVDTPILSLHRKTKKRRLTPRSMHILLLFFLLNDQ